MSAALAAGIAALATPAAAWGLRAILRNRRIEQLTRPAKRPPLTDGVMAVARAVQDPPAKYKAPPGGVLCIVCGTVWPYDTKRCCISALRSAS